MLFCILVFEFNFTCPLYGFVNQSFNCGLYIWYPNGPSQVRINFGDNETRLIYAQNGYINISKIYSTAFIFNITATLLANNYTQIFSSFKSKYLTKYNAGFHDNFW